ncbi:MAG: response regulator transcription factor [Phycisphaeraceae bacterium]|nr:response regulator transcription factor [Phycisphaeraceae bacterium]
MSQLRDTELSGVLPPTVYVVDDDDAMRRGLKFLITSAGYEVEAFDSAQAFLDHDRAGPGGCLVLDVRMPGMDGLQLFEQLRARNIAIPVIFITAFGNIAMAVRAVKAGAYDFIEKPFEGAALLARIRQSLSQATQPRDRQSDTSEIRKRLESLTPRERQVMDRVVAGMLNKQIAGELDISIKTVETHRAQVMQKLQAQSLAELVRMVIATESAS